MAINIFYQNQRATKTHGSGYINRKETRNNAKYRSENQRMVTTFQGMEIHISANLSYTLVVKNIWKIADLQSFKKIYPTFLCQLVGYFRPCDFWVTMQQLLYFDNFRNSL